MKNAGRSWNDGGGGGRSDCGQSRAAHRNLVRDRRRLRTSGGRARPQRNVRPGGETLGLHAVGHCYRLAIAAMRNPATRCASASRAISGCGARPTTGVRCGSMCCSRAGWSCRGGARLPCACRARTGRRTTSDIRYVKAARIDEGGQPSGDLTLWDAIQFPFDPALREVSDLSEAEISRNGDGGGPEVEEEYTCDANGMVKVTIWNRSAAYGREYTLGRWLTAEAQSISRRSPSGRGRGKRHR